MSNYCNIAPGHPVHAHYHAREYGFPQRDERELFERLVLEINQAGLSWETILKKREGFRGAYSGFDVDKVAGYGEKDRTRLLADAGIIRNRLKVQSIIKNARAYLALEAEGVDFVDYLWGFVGGAPIVNQRQGNGDIPATSPESDAMAKALKKRGFTFVGSTICYAFMQAVGMVNDHVADCFRQREIGDLLAAERL